MESITVSDVNRKLWYRLYDKKYNTLVLCEKKKNTKTIELVLFYTVRTSLVWRISKRVINPSKNDYTFIEKKKRRKKRQSLYLN